MLSPFIPERIGERYARRFFIKPRTYGKKRGSHLMKPLPMFIDAGGISRWRYKYCICFGVVARAPVLEGLKRLKCRCGEEKMAEEGGKSFFEAGEPRFAVELSPAKRR